MRGSPDLSLSEVQRLTRSIIREDPADRDPLVEGDGMVTRHAALVPEGGKGAEADIFLAGTDGRAKSPVTATLSSCAGSSSIQSPKPVKTTTESRK